MLRRQRFLFYRKRAFVELGRAAGGNQGGNHGDGQGPNEKGRQSVTTDLRNGKKPREASGRFALGNSGGPGRLKRLPNRTTIDAREIRRRVIDSWGRVDADAKLDELATENFPAYLRLLAPLLPKNEPPQTSAEWRDRLWVAIEAYSAARVQRIAGAVVLVLAAMPRTAREGVFEHVIEGLGNSDLTPEDCRELVSDLTQAVMGTE